LTDLGAPRGLQLIRKPWALPHECEVEAAEAFGPSDKLTKVTNHSQIVDLPKLFAYLADKVASTRDERGRLLLKLLDQQWAEWETRAGGPAATVPPWWQSTYHYYPAWKRRGREEIKSLPCEFLQLLHSEAWVPVRGDGEPQRPKEVWVSNQDGGLGFSAGRCLGAPLSG
jgi:virulence-associated protein VagC